MLVTVTQAFGVPLSTRHEFSLCPLPFGQHKSCSGSGLLLSVLNLQVVFGTWAGSLLTEATVTVPNFLLVRTRVCDIVASHKLVLT